jgi:hypothetical protein
MVLYFRGCQKVIASVNSGIDEGSLGLWFKRSKVL